MKKIIAILLCLSTLLSCVSCETLEAEKASETLPTKTEEKNVTKPAEEKKTVTVPDPLTWEKIDAIPVATADMSEEELRKICVEYFNLQLSYQWTPSTSFTYEIESYDRLVDIKEGELYIGSPYDSGQGNLYKIMNRYNPETGVLTTTKNGEQNTDFMGNHCTSASHWGWSRISNSFTFTLTKTVTEANGAIKVGPYKYPNEGKEHKETKDVCTANGEQIMFQSYALLQPADGVVCFNNNAGHVMMISVAPHIEYLANGEIDGKRSYLQVMEQVSSWEKEEADGATFSRQGRIDKEYTFQGLYKSGYLPFTVKELLGKDPVEKGYAKLETDKETLTLEELRDTKLASNYEISDVTVRVYDENGKEAYKYIANYSWVNYKVSLSSAVFPATLSSFAKKGGHSIEITCRIGTGELFTVYSGNL